MSNILLITGPHGAGKDTVENGLRLRRPDIRRIVRHITRAAAAGEVNGEDYHYINNEHFEQLVADDSFAEWSRYPDSSSGTAWNEIMTGCYDDSYSSPIGSVPAECGTSVTGFNVPWVYRSRCFQNNVLFCLCSIDFD